jgi:hypothetical protein
MVEEIGRELSPTELNVGMLVVVAPPQKNVYLTMWVSAIDPKTVVFHASVLNWSVINVVRDDKIFDDKERQVHVFEYLGDP